MWTSIIHLSGRPLRAPYRNVSVQAKVNQVANALHRWAAENGCESIGQRWNVDTVPRGERIGGVELFRARRDGLSDRWQMAPWGPRPTYPQIAVQIVASEKPPQSEVTISTVGSLNSAVEVGSAEEKRWEAIVQSVADAVAKAPEFNAATMSVDKPPIRHEGESSPWGSLALALGGMGMWVIVMIRFLTPRTGVEGLGITSNTQHPTSNIQ
jgi:hypothetical protein